MDKVDEVDGFGFTRGCRKWGMQNAECGMEPRGKVEGRLFFELPFGDAVAAEAGTVAEFGWDALEEGVGNLDGDAPAGAFVADG